MPPRNRKPVSVVRAKPTPEVDELAGTPAPVAAEPAAKPRRTRATPPAIAPPASPGRKATTKEDPLKGSGPRSSSKPTADTDVPAAPARRRRAQAASTTPSATGPARSIQRTYWIQTGVLDDVRAAVTHLRSYVPESKIMTITDVLEPALRVRVKQLQDKYNDGERFPRTATLHTGRPPGSTTQSTVRVSLLLPSDLIDDLRAAVNYLYAYEPDAGILNLSSLLNPALRKRVAELEKKYNNGEKFRRVTRAPTGRPRR